MSEQLRESHERAVESIDTSAEKRTKLEALKEKAENAPELNVETVRHAVENKAVSGKEITVGERESAPKARIDRTVKNQTYKKTIRKVQSNLSRPERSFSRLIHQPVVEKASNIGAVTVARPSGFLLGSITALIGSATVVFLAKRNGFSYNYSILLLLFAGGYLAGVVLELLWRLVLRRKK